MGRLFEMMKEASTYRGLAWMLGAAGVTISPDQVGVIAAGAMALVGVIDTFKKDRKGE